MNEEIVFDQEDVNKNKTNGILMAIIPILFFLPLVSDDMKNSAFLKFRANQTLIYLLAAIAVNICGWILKYIPYVGGILSWALSIAVFVLYVINIVYAANGNGKKLPLIGGIEILK